MSETNDLSSILAYYNSGLEETRLQHGIGLLEFSRTVEILQNVLPDPPAVVADIGGGAGVYSLWLSQHGYQSFLFDLSPVNAALARDSSSKQPKSPIAITALADGRALPCSDVSVDVALVMGPLYHLPERSDRLAALREANRLLKPNGLIVAACISRYGSLLWALSTYCARNEYLSDNDFIAMVSRELREGQHIPSVKFPHFLARGYFHLPDALREEMVESDFHQVEIIALEGPGWIVPSFEEMWADEAHREPILSMIRKVEKDPALMGMSPHILGLGRK